MKCCKTKLEMKIGVGMLYMGAVKQNELSICRAYYKNESHLRGATFDLSKSKLHLRGATHV